MRGSQGRVERDVLGDLALPAIAVREQALLVVIELLARLGGEFEIRAFDDGVDGAGFLAKATIDALHHIDIVARGSARSIIASRAGFNGDCLRWANCLAKLARDAAFLAVRITTQGMFATKAWRDRAFFERIIERRFRLEEVAHGQHEAGQELRQKQAFGCAIESHRFLISSRRLPVRRTG
jgi:hypothetical protein